MSSQAAVTVAVWGEERRGVVENTGGMSSVDQVAVVVRDIDAAMEHYTNDLGIGPWAVYKFSLDWIRDMTF